MVTIEFETKQRAHLKEGSETVKLTGKSFVTLTTADDRSARINPSGPVRATFISEDPKTGVTVFRVEARGRNFFYAATAGERAISAELGLPTLTVTSGPVDVTLTTAADGEVLDADLHRRPPRALDACDLLR